MKIYELKLRNEDVEYLEKTAVVHRMLPNKFITCLINAHRQGRMMIDADIFNEEFVESDTTDYVNKNKGDLK